MKIVALLITGLLLTSIIASVALASPASTKKNVDAYKNNSNTTENKTRGEGLDVAIRHVPDFVAEKLSYMRELFQGGTKGIGQALSDWIHAFFKPVIKNKNETENKTE